MDKMNIKKELLKKLLNDLGGMEEDISSCSLAEDEMCEMDGMCGVEDDMDEEFDLRSLLNANPMEEDMDEYDDEMDDENPLRIFASQVSSGIKKPGLEIKKVKAPKIKVRK